MAHSKRTIPWIVRTLAGLLALSAAAAVLAQSGASTAAAQKPAASRKAAPPKAAASAAQTTGFAIGPAPAWVRPAAPDPSIQLDSAPIQALLIDRQIRLEPSGTVKFVHFVRQINDASGVQKGGQVSVEFDPSYQRLVLHQLVVWRGSQKIDKLDRKAVNLLHRETQLERQVVDGRMTASIVIDDLRAGDRVEFAASLIGDNPVFGGHFVDDEWTVDSIGPVGLLQIRLLAAPQRDIRYRSANPAVEVASEVRDGWRETWFRRRAAPQFHFDPTLPAAEYLKEQIEFSEYADWAEVAGWAQELFAKAIQPTPAVHARIADIESQASSPEDRLRKALNFVQRDIRYFGTEIGPDSHQPATADTVLRQRFGDCKDKVALLTTLADGLGLKATPVLVSTRYGDDVPARLPSPLAFDHVIARVGLAGQTLWLDATRARQTGALATRQPAGLGYGLPAEAGTAAPLALPLAAEALRSETIDSFSFPKLAQEGTLESVTTYYGDAAEWIFEAQSAVAADQFEKALDANYLRFYPSLVSTEPPKLEPVPDRNAVRITRHFRTGDYWRFPEQRGLVGSYALEDLLSPLRLPDQNPRSTPLRIAMPGIYRQTVKFDFGEELPAQPSSNHFDETNNQFSLHVQYQGGSHQQSVEGELDLTGTVIPAAEWTSYRDAVTKVAPRLFNGFMVAAVAPDQLPVLRTELQSLSQSLRSGKQKLAYPEQGTAQVQLIMLDHELSSNRLPDKLRAEALVAKGSALDNLGRADEAKPFFEQALALNKDSALAHAAYAVNAFSRGSDEQAIEEASHSIEHAPADTGARYTRAWARYFAGQYPQSQDEWLEILHSRSEIERSYASIWLYFTARRLGGDAAGAVKPYLPMGNKPTWPYPVLQWMAGQSDFDATLAASRDAQQRNPGHECELYFFAGERALLDSDPDRARGYFRKSIDTGVAGFVEYNMATRELARLDKK